MKFLFCFLIVSFVYPALGREIPEAFSISFKRMYSCIKPLDHSSVFDPVYRSYTYGGILWPQLRWANNIFVVEALYYNPNVSLTSFLKTRLSDQQLKRTAHLMNFNHKLYGVTMGSFDVNELLEKEWYKTQQRVFWTLSQFFLIVKSFL